MNLTPEKRNQLVLTALLCAGAVYATFEFGIKGLQKKHQKEAMKRDELAQTIRKTQSAIRVELQNREEAKAYNAFIESAENQMPKGNPETWLVQELTGIASTHQLQIQNTTLQSLSEINEIKFRDQPYRIQGFRFELKGELDQIGLFLQEMEQKHGLIEVDEITITAGSDIAPHVHSVAVRIGIVTKA
jgi:Tfp pilus assembly protein PilO